jgi:hypothetical protein
MRFSLVGLCVLLAWLPIEASSQSPASPPAQTIPLASRVARSIRTNGNDGRALPILTQARKPESRTLMDEIADTLAAIAMEPSVDDVANTRARSQAISILHLAGLGESGLPGGVPGIPYSGAASRLRRIVESSYYLDVRQLALKRLSNLDRSPAFLRYLRQHALGSTMVAAIAVEILADDRGAEGRAIARELYRTKAVMHDYAKRVLEARARERGW